MRFVTLLWHGDEPIGICVFAAPARSLAQRGRYFGLSGRWSRTKLQALNSQIVTLARVVVHPTYRGAGVASEFIRRSCAACRWPWIETLAEMGHVSGVFERAGFVRVDVSRSRARKSRSGLTDLYGGAKRKDGQARRVTRETYEKSRHAEPVYYVLDNRAHAARAGRES